MGQKQVNQEAQSRNVLRQKKASSKMTKTVESLLVGLLVVILATALAPDMFSNVAVLEQENITRDGTTYTNPTPDWVPVALYVIIGIGIVLTIYYVFLKSK